MDGWGQLQDSGRRLVIIDGSEVGAGSRVRLLPRSGGDVFDLALAGRMAVVESVEEDTDGNVQLAVTVEDDPGRDLGTNRHPGHRFFFTPEEVEPLLGEPPPAGARVLVAGVGNVFMADDAFGVELARLLAERELPPGVTVKDFGIRGMDLVYALGEGYDAAVLLDASPRGGVPGEVRLIEAEMEEDAISLDTHGMDPVRVLRLARELGPAPERVLVVTCEPAIRMSGDEDEVVAELSEPVRAALEPAAELVESTVRSLCESKQTEGE